MSEAIHLTVRRTKADYFWGVMVSALRNARMWLLYAAGAIFVAAIAVVMNSDNPLWVRAVMAVGTFTLMMLFYALFYVICVVFAATKNWKLPGAFSEIAFDLSDEGIAVSSDTGSGVSKWIVWKSSFETKRLIIIRHQTGLIQIIPKRDLTPTTLERVRAMLAAHLAPQQVQGGMP